MRTSVLVMAAVIGATMPAIGAAENMDPADTRVTPTDSRFDLRTAVVSRPALATAFQDSTTHTGLFGGSRDRFMDVRGMLDYRLTRGGTVSGYVGLGYQGTFSGRTGGASLAADSDFFYLPTGVTTRIGGASRGWLLSAEYRPVLSGSAGWVDGNRASVTPEFDPIADFGLSLSARLDWTTDGGHAMQFEPYYDFWNGPDYRLIPGDRGSSGLETLRPAGDEFGFRFNLGF